jgi:AcrR family transcriptional regulator
VSPRGRRPAGEDTRSAIIEAARQEFAEQGYDATSLRGVARRAGVDPALVHHYFAGKPGLFAEVMSLPGDVRALVGAIVSLPREEVGAAVVRTFLQLWDSPAGRLRFLGLLRSAVTHEEAARMVREFLVREVFGRVTRAFSTDGGQAAAGGAGDADLRASLAAGQMVGVAMLRYVLEFPAVVDASPEQLVERVGPVLQGYLAP